jgi:3-hydroxyisobutyrate dehydrogenase
MIAFLGMGLLGSNFVRAVRRRGQAVQVWNRSPLKARELEAVGATPCDTPALAVTGAQRVHLTLSDDAAVDAVLEAARPGLTPRTIIVDHSTTSTTGVLQRVDRWRARGITYVHAPVFMGPANALESSGLMMVSGDPSLVTPLEPVLREMTGTLRNLGHRPDAAAAFKLLGNCFLMFINAGLADTLSLARAMNLGPDAGATLLEFFNPGATAPARMQRMLTANFITPSWELSMARKDARLMLEEAVAGQRPLAVLPAIAARMDTLLAQGLGHHDWTVMAADALGPQP